MEEYEDIVEAIEQQEEFKQKFLAKCDFDMITKRDTVGTGLSAKQLQILDPMLAF
jgi:hypothetical protein